MHEMIETMDLMLKERSERAVEVVHGGSRVALDYFAKRRQLMVEVKADPQDVVSQADREVEALIRAHLLQHFPQDEVVGEEGDQSFGRAEFTWVVDPIDGTMPFLSGLPHWCIALALVHRQQTVLAVTYAPVLDLMYHAVLGGGATLNGLPLRVDSMQGLAGRMTGIGVSHRADPEQTSKVIAGVLQAGGIFYRTGSGALMLAEVAAGKLAGYYEPHMNAWDCLGGLLLVSESGGTVAGIKMAQMLSDGGPVMAGAPRAYQQLEAIVASLGA